MCVLLLGRLLDGTGEVHVPEDGADDPASGRLRIDRGQQRTFTGETLRHRTAGGDREDRAVAVRCRRQRLRAILEDDGVRQRPQRGDERPLETGLGAHEILQHTGRAASMRAEETRSGRFLDVAPASLQELEARSLPALDVVELLDLLDRATAFGLQLRAALRQR